MGVESFVRKNERYQPVRGKPFPRIITTSKYKKWLAVVAEEVRRQGVPLLNYGRWSLTVITVWPTLRHLDVEVPMGDSDASLSAMKDALETAGVLDNDARVVADRTFNLYRKGERRIVALLERTDHNPLAEFALYDALAGEVNATRAGHAYRSRTLEAELKSRAPKQTKRTRATPTKAKKRVQ